jgi:transcriptional repressor NrdR
MKCISCDYPDSHVVSSEKKETNNLIRRRRECLRCGVRFTTQEKYRDDKLPSEESLYQRRILK